MRGAFTDSETWCNWKVSSMAFGLICILHKIEHQRLQSSVAFHACWQQQELAQISALTMW